MSNGGSTPLLIYSQKEANRRPPLSAFWERGSPDFPACGLRRGSSGGPAWPIFISSSSRPSRGAKPRGVDDRKLPQRQPHQAGSRGGGEIKVGVPREEPVTQAMTIETRRVPGRRRPAQCPFFPFGAQGASTGQGIRQRLPFRCNKTKTKDCKMEVILEPKTASPLELCAGKDRFCQDSLY